MTLPDGHLTLVSFRQETERHFELRLVGRPGQVLAKCSHRGDAHVYHGTLLVVLTLIL